jgi:hypothetical protein
MEFINSESISIKIWHQMLPDAIFTVVFLSGVRCKPLFPIFRDKKTIIIAKKINITRKMQKRGN